MALRVRNMCIVFQHGEKEAAVPVKDIAAGAEVLRRAAADVAFPGAGDRRPIKSLTAVIFGQRADAGGSAPADLERRVGKFLKDRRRRISEGDRERHQRSIFLFMVRRRDGRRAILPCGEPRRRTSGTDERSDACRINEIGHKGCPLSQMLLQYRVLPFD
jgi:hypothetical protein